MISESDTSIDKSRADDSGSTNVQSRDDTAEMRRAAGQGGRSGEGDTLNGRLVKQLRR